MPRIKMFICLILVSILVGIPGAYAGADTSRADVELLEVPSAIVMGDGGECPNIVIAGMLGSGSSDWPSTSGNQTGRLNRDAVISECGSPKACNIFTSDGLPAYDAYQFHNNSNESQCVEVLLTVIDQAGCNLQVNAYSPTYDPANICTDYLADPGFSSGIPPSPVSMSFDIDPDEDFILVVHTTNPGEIDCNYELEIAGDICSKTPIPTLDSYGLVGFLLLLLGIGTYFIIRRRMAR